MAKVQIKSEKITPFGGIFHVREHFSRFVGPVMDKVLGLRCTSFGYQYSEIVGSLSSVYYDFNTATKLNSLLVKVLMNTSQLVAGASYDLDFDHQFIETEKYDAKMTYKKFTGYSPGVAVIGDLIVGIENRDGNANVRFRQQDTLERIFSNLEQNGIRIKAFVFKFISVPAKWIRTARHYQLNIYTDNKSYQNPFAFTDG